MRKNDAWGNPILQQGDVVRSRWDREEDPDFGTVTKILQVNANGAYVVGISWFQWRAAGDNPNSEEYVSDLILMSEA